MILVPQEGVLYNLFMRLDGYVSKFSGFSRSQSRKMIRSQRVVVNGRVVDTPSASVSANDEVLLDGKHIKTFGMVYIALNKPGGFVCSRERDEGENVFDLIDEVFSAELSIAGRLDKDTTGLVILSNDGEFIHNVISPNKLVEKEYLVETVNKITSDEISLLSQGVSIGDEEFSMPVSVEELDSFHLRIVLTEGRYHEVKRLVLAVGNKVRNLHRNRIGTYYLPDRLSPGKWIYLSETDRKRITGT